MIKEINSIKDIQELLTSGFTDWRQYGNVKVTEKEELVIFNYTQKAQFEARWNFFEQVSRGLILNKTTGEVIARPFDKFFNWGEGALITTTFTPIDTVMEKVDGSLGILYKHNGIYKIATRGSFDSEQALWATEFLHRNYNIGDLTDEMTLLFEIVYPDNRVVVDYKGKEDLVLLDIRNRYTGDYYWQSTVKSIAKSYGFSSPQTYEYETIQDVIFDAQNLDANSEGFVVKFCDGQRFKVKGSEYCKIHKLLSGLSFKTVLQSVMDDTIDDYLDLIPDEFFGQVADWSIEIDLELERTVNEIERVFELAPKSSRKEFALWVNEHHKGKANYLFARLDERDMRDIFTKKCLKFT